MKQKLYEGMWAGDLSDLVQPLVTIDEYSSKINTDAIVVGFYVHDRDAADDLNRFIQKSPISIVDADVSPAPDQRGFYMVFVEIAFNDRLVPSIVALLDEVSPLVDVTDWQMKVRNVKGTVKFDEKILSRVLKANYIADQIKLLKNEIKALKQATKNSK